MKEQSRSFKFLGTLIAYVAYPRECLVVVTQILADVPVAYVAGNGDEKGKRPVFILYSNQSQVFIK
jgi:ABC-type sulfate transport system substrate-binding protein